MKNSFDTTRPETALDGKRDSEIDAGKEREGETPILKEREVEIPILERGRERKRER